jgi:kynurenine formamidase
MKILILLLFLCAKSFSQTYDLYVAQKKSSPTLVFVHGGAWISGDKSDYQEMAQKLSQQNFCVAVINYSLAPAFQHPQTISDLDSVLTKLQSKKNKNCNFKKIYLIGHSAGAHLIAYWAHKNDSKNIKGFIGLEGIYDLPALAKKWPSYPDWFIKKEFGDEKLWPEASPALIEIKNKAPWLLVHSEDDELVDSRQTDLFADQLKKQKIKYEVLKVKGASHFVVLKLLTQAKGPLALKLNKLSSQ